MAIKVYNVQAISRKLSKIRETLKDRDLLERIGRTSISHIQDRTRKGLDKDASALKPLAPITIENRQRLEKFNRTGAGYETTKSNLTLTGDFLRALKATFAPGKIVLMFTGYHKTYKQSKKDKRRNNGLVEMSQLAQWQKEKGRDILGVDQSLRVKIRELVARHLRRSMNRFR